ncbi:hypothetical protein HRED_10699 [Candidatus Haloredivivus sp. G17]|nr:hypothetical protein HRED_10699 [Candidatus Haloredivivus sp. G17]
MKEIIHENISSQGIEVINEEPVSVLNDEEFKKKLNAQRSDKAKAQEIEQGVKQALSVKMVLGASVLRFSPRESRRDY